MAATKSDWVVPKFGRLSQRGAIGRFGAAYVRNVCATAHIGFSEGSLDEDVLAVDGTVEFAAAGVRVQIKTTTRLSLKPSDNDIKFALDPAWVQKWRENIHPTYIILVIADRELENWLHFEDSLTRSHSIAFWARVDNLADDASHVIFERGKRFTCETVVEWGEELSRDYGA